MVDIITLKAATSHRDPGRAVLIFFMIIHFHKNFCTVS